jgi:hypothetical protein
MLQIMEPGIKNVTLWYSINNGTTWTIINMTELPIPSSTVDNIQGEQ